jgi:hypothetical protein
MVNGGFPVCFGVCLRGNNEIGVFSGAYYTNLEKVKETVSRKSTIQFPE